MNELIERILGQSAPKKVAILAATVVLLFAVFYSFVYAPRSEEIAKLADSVEIARNERQVKLAKAANLPRLQAELRAMEIKLKEAVAQLPDRKEIPDLLAGLSNKAREAGLEILLFRPRAENFQDFYAEIPVDIVVRGGFFNAVAFFDDVSRLHRIVNIDNLDFRNPRVSGEQVTMDISTLATTYRFLDEAERKKVAEAKAKAAKK
ncbi:MAG TPA: type 4a pilus biogenesis protein PilO [Methylomirabilota bacterium]|nr:type 4a pilus biogenesis protein PilO [Methylomirabilota bacterium]